MFMVPGGRGEHHTRAPCALSAAFQRSRRLSPVPAVATRRSVSSAPARLLKRRCEVLGLFIWRSLLGPFEADNLI